MLDRELAIETVRDLLIELERTRKLALAAAFELDRLASPDPDEPTGGA